MTQPDPDPRRPDGARAPWDGLIALAALIIVLAVLIAPPHGLLDKADRAAFAVCHRIPERSFVFIERPLPLCARCSGTYLGALVGLITLVARGRRRASSLPERRYLAVLALFMVAWAIDGFNSFLTLFPGAPHLYEPNNLFRLITGTLQGLVLAVFILPMLNLALWAAPSPARAIGSWADLGWMSVGAAAIIGLVSSEWTFLLYPLAIVSGVTIPLLLGVVNTMMVLIVLRREGRATHWRQAIAPLLLGLALASVELMLIGLARAALTERLGLLI